MTGGRRCRLQIASTKNSEILMSVLRHAKYLEFFWHSRRVFNFWGNRKGYPILCMQEAGAWQASSELGKRFFAAFLIFMPVLKGGIREAMIAELYSTTTKARNKKVVDSNLNVNPNPHPSWAAELNSNSSSSRRYGSHSSVYKPAAAAPLLLANANDSIPNQELLLSLQGHNCRPNTLENWGAANNEAWDRDIPVFMNETFCPVEEIIQSYLHTSNCSSYAALANKSNAEIYPPLIKIGDIAEAGKEATPEQEWRQTEGAAGTGTSTSNNTEEEQGLNLVSLLLQAGEYVTQDKTEEAKQVLAHIAELASPFGSPMHRVAAYLAEAINCRIVSSYLNCAAAAETSAEERDGGLGSLQKAFQVYNGITPVVKFWHFTANEAIQQAVRDAAAIHIVDLDIMQGLQWPGLFHLLSRRGRPPPPRVRITGVGRSADALHATGRRLAAFAHTLGIPFEFRAVTAASAAHLSPERLLPPRHAADANDDADPSADAVVVQWAAHSLYSACACRDAGAVVDLLRRMRRRVRVVTVVEQELLRTPCVSFSDALAQALHYYAAMFDALGCCAQAEDGRQRYVVEQQLLSREMRNALRVRGVHQHPDVRRALREVGFVPVSLAGSAAAQASLLLRMFPCDGYTLVDDAGALRLGWHHHPLFTASAWQGQGYGHGHGHGHG